MKGFIEKLIGRLEEELKLAEIDRERYLPGNSTQFNYGKAVGYGNGMSTSISIVNQLAEEYNNESVKGDLISRSALLKTLNEYVEKAYDCGGIDDENVIEYQQTHDDKSAYIIQGFNEVYELLEDVPTTYNDGWIPCSERLPEESGEYYIYVYYNGHYMYAIDEIDCDGMVKKWNCVSDYQIIAWKPIEPYQPKGE